MPTALSLPVTGLSQDRRGEGGRALWESSSAGSAPIAFASVAYCIVEPRAAGPPWGEAFAVAGLRDASVVVVGRGATFRLEYK